MLVFKQKTETSPALFSQFHTPDTTLFFDIETTGLSPESNFIYLICAGYLENEVPTLLQWFAEGPEDEPKVISAFLDFAADAEALVHFNGDMFDVPFVEKRAAKYEIPCSLAYLKQFDILKMVRKCKTDLGLSSCSQKSVEKLLGIARDDKYNGGELIEVYKQYVGRSRYDKLTHGTPLAPVPGSGLSSMPRTPSEALLTLLLLHNFEDVEGLIRISSLCPLLSLLSAEALPKEDFVCTLKDRELELYFEFETDLPCTLNSTAERTTPIRFIAGPKGIKLYFGLFNGSLKHYYEDYKNYYYLPEEDQAVHKSVGAGVDKDHRQNATKETCYIKQTGAFVPLLLPSLPSFKDSYKSRTFYTEAKNISTVTKDEFLEAVLSAFAKIK